VDDPPGGEAIPFADTGLTGGTTPDLPRFLKEFRPCPLMDGSIHPTASQEGGVGCINNGIHLLFGNISFYDLHPPFHHPTPV
jgi:hypothetical protein